MKKNKKIIIISFLSFFFPFMTSIGNQYKYLENCTDNRGFKLELAINPNACALQLLTQPINHVNSRTSDGIFLHRNA